MKNFRNNKANSSVIVDRSVFVKTSEEKAELKKLKTTCKETTPKDYKPKVHKYPCI